MTQLRSTSLELLNYFKYQLAGIYIHIPYCAQACHYCDFHFSTQLDSKVSMITAICEEIEIRKNYLGREKINSIYFGGGTPSLLSREELALILDKIREHFIVSPKAEITLESNPDDISSEALTGFHVLGINRLSLGVQSFDDSYLEYLNRSHSSDQARQALQLIRESEISNFNLDLIFGIKPDDGGVWQSDLEEAVAFKPTHLSVYNLTIEEKTVFGSRVKKGLMKPVEDHQTEEHFRMAHNFLGEKGFEHYEISNYCFDGQYAKHNTSYWQDEKYLGVGPGAHSYDRLSRQKNVTNNSLYIRAINDKKLPMELEALSKIDKINERIMTGLRTVWGCNINDLKGNFGHDILVAKGKEIDRFENAGLLIIDDSTIKLTLDGQLLADSITEELME